MRVFFFVCVAFSTTFRADFEALSSTRQMKMTELNWTSAEQLADIRPFLWRSSFTPAMQSIGNSNLIYYQSLIGEGVHGRRARRKQKKLSFQIDKKSMNFLSF